MPGIPSNITIAGRTPATIKGNLPPLINTAEAARGGFRAGDDSGGGSDPVNPIEPSEWEAILERFGSGTADSTFDPKVNITYQGAFRIPSFFNSVATSGTIGAMAYMPANGSNGPNGSVFLAGQNRLAEVRIPGIGVSETLAGLPVATVNQNFFKPYDAAPIPDGSDESVKKTRIGSMKVVGQKLYMTHLNDYDNSGSNDFNLLICNDPNDLAGATYQGFIDRELNDLGARYMMNIPESWQETFGGTHFSGINAEVSIIGRSSFGHSLISWSPASIQADDTTASAQAWVSYSGTNTVPGWSEWNADITSYYEQQLGIDDMEDYLTSDPSTRPSTPAAAFDVFPLPDPSLRKISGSLLSKSGFGFIPPGSDTVVYIGSNSGMRYGAEYKIRQLESGTNNGDTSGGAPWSRFDWDNVIWTMNLNDIASADNPYSPDYIRYGIFDSNRWTTKGSYRMQGEILSGDFDAENSRIFLLHTNIPEGQFGLQFVVSVYQVSGGV